MRIPFSKTLPAKVWRYVNKRNRRPTLPGGLSTPYDKAQVNIDEQIVMMAAGARDKAQASAALEGYDTALSWLNHQPSRQSRRAARFIGWLRRALGYYEFDPLTIEMEPRRPRLKVRYRRQEEK
jgi:hypothetical protein